MTRFTLSSFKKPQTGVYEKEDECDGLMDAGGGYGWGTYFMKVSSTTRDLNIGAPKIQGGQLWLKLCVKAIG